MKKDTYIKYIEYTLGTYNKANKRQLIKLYKDAKLVKKKEEQPSLFDDDLIGIDYSNLDNTIVECIKSIIKLLKYMKNFNLLNRINMLFCLNVLILIN